MRLIAIRGPSIHHGPVRQCVRLLGQRDASIASSSFLVKAFSTSSERQAKAKGPEKFRDENIRARRVRFISPETNEVLPGPFDTRELLASIDRKRFFLQQVQGGRQQLPTQSEATASGSDRRGGPTKGRQQGPSTSPSGSVAPPVVRATSLTLDDLPIVKLIDKKEEYDRERAAKQERQAAGGTKSKSSASMHKDVAFTWNSTLYDRHHKLRPIRANLIKRGPGASCRVMISSKKSSVVIRDEDKDAFVAEVERYLCDWQAIEEKDLDAAEDDDEGNPIPKPADLPYFARRRADIEWHSGRRQAMLRIEVSRR